MRHALVNPDTGEVLRIMSRQEVDPAVKTRFPLKWLPVVEAVIPNFNPATETLNPVVQSVSAESLTETITKRSLTTQELDDAKTARVNNVFSDVVLARLFLNLHNRIRALEGQSAHTMAQLIAFLKSQVP